MELTNDDRRYLGLPPLADNWEQLSFGAITLYLDGTRVCRRIRRDDPGQIADYVEDEIDRELSADQTHILAATSRGKPVALTEATAGTRLSPSGMCVQLGRYAGIHNSRTGRDCVVDDPQVPDPGAVSAGEWLAAWKLPRGRRI